MNRVRLDWRLVAAWGVLALLAAWLVSPAMRPVHVEGFSASIVALGIHMADGTLTDFLPSQPMTTEYFGLTKLGAVLAVAGLVKLGLAGDTAMRLLMAAGALLLAGGSARLVRSWSGAPWLLVAAILLLVPGLAESDFFFNDNILGAGLIVAALAILQARPEPAAALGIGALIGMAVAVRTDLVLVTPAVFLMAGERRTLAQAAATTIIVGTAALSLLWVIYTSVGASPLDAVRAGEAAVELWARPIDPQAQCRSILSFLGLPISVLGVIGLVGLHRERRRLMLLVGVPLSVNLVLLGKVWETRQLLPLTPFLATIATLGACRLISDWRAGNRVPPGLVAMTIATILFAAPTGVYFSDGPRVLVGRVAAIGEWTAWQARVRDNFALIDRMIATAPRAGTLVIVTDYWDEDRYLHLRLVEQGFRADTLTPACRAVGQSMMRNGRRIVQVSPRLNFVANGDAVSGQVVRQFAAPCLRAVPAPVIMIANADRVAWLDVPGNTAPVPRRQAGATFAVTRLSAPLLDRLPRFYRGDVATRPAGEYRMLRDSMRAMRKASRWIDRSGR